MTDNKTESVWEMFIDAWYYDLWCVRNTGDRSFNSPLSFHFEREKDAEDFLVLVRIAK